MFPGINQKQLQQAMKQLGVKQENIDAIEVIIKTPTKNIVIKNPQVAKVNMMGQETFQVSGDIEESYPEDDIKLIIEQTNCSREKAIKALEKNNGDIAQAILSLKA
jgi:nascent polypeptide-associated complex subunit alpha